MTKSSHYVNKALAFETLGPWVEEFSNFINRMEKIIQRPSRKAVLVPKTVPCYSKGKHCQHPWNSSKFYFQDEIHNL